MREGRNRRVVAFGVASVLVAGAVSMAALAGEGDAPRPDAAAARPAPVPVPPAPGPAAEPARADGAATTTAPAVTAPVATARDPVPTTTPPRGVASRPAATRAGRGASPLAAAWLAAGARNVDAAAGPPAPAAQRSGGGPAPVGLEIPAIGVDAPVDPTGLNPDGTLAVPEDFARTSWYTGWPAPGEVGPAVIVGHVDNRSGPAVFYRLRQLAPGGEVIVHRADGSRVVFVVERTKQVPKHDFPTEEVYGPTPGPTLRLITCGGSFDRSTRHYRDNIVVFLRMEV